MLLASNFDGAIPFMLGVLIIITILGLVSYIPAWYGHWSALVLAVPCTLLGLLLLYSLFASGIPDKISPIFWLLFSAPFIVGSGSLRLWRSRQREKQVEE
jgi:hypothetical protein